MVTFLLTLAGGLTWNYGRPAEYRASSRVQLDIPQQLQLGPAAGTGVATRMQWLSSASVLDKVVQVLPRPVQAPPGAPADAAAHLRSLLQLQPVAGSDVVELTATGPDPQLLAELLNALPEVARAELAHLQASESDRRLDAARAELARLEKVALERRAQLDAFRARAGVMAEREDNESVARSRSVAQALAAATEKEAAAAGRLKSLNDALAAGQLGSGVRADATLGGLEARASQVREELREMERIYTSEFMALDPKARGLRTRLTELERQIAQQRLAVQRHAVQQATEEHAAAQAQLERLRLRAAEERPALVRTQGKLTEARVLEDDLAQVEKARREVLERVSRLEADDSRRVATLTVVDAAAVPTRPLRPDYTRDALWVLAAAFAAALAVTGTVELFHRVPAPPSAASTTLVVQPPWPPAPLPVGAGPVARLPGASGARWPDGLPALAPPIAVLAQPEAAALLAATDGATRRLCALALLGLTPAEMTSLRVRDVVDRELRVGAPSPRRVPLPAWFVAALPTDPELPLVADAAGTALSEDDMAAMIVSAALDAGLDAAAGVSAETLRHTCIAWLLDQGLRFAELPGRVGRISPAVLQAFAARHAGGAPREPRAVEFVMPALRIDPAGGSAT